MILDRKTNVILDFGGRNIELDKDFLCPTCAEKTRITGDMAMNVASPVATTCAVYAEYVKPINTFQKNPKKQQDYFAYAVPLHRARKRLSAISNRAMSLATSIELNCGHKIPVSIECGIKEVAEPKKQDVLHQLGLNTKNAYRWLSYIYTGRVNEQWGKRKAAEIMEIVNRYHTEKEALENFQKDLGDKIPPSITGYDLHGDVSSGIRKILDELDVVMRSIIHDLDETLARVAMRPDKELPIKSWVAAGVTQ